MWSNNWSLEGARIEEVEQLRQSGRRSVPPMAQSHRRSTYAAVAALFSATFALLLAVSLSPAHFSVGVATHAVIVRCADIACEH